MPKVLQQCILFTFFFLSCFNKSVSQVIQKKADTKKNKKLSNYKISFKIIAAPDNTYGYDIYNDEKIIIHQPNKPGLQGNKGFIKKQDAIKVATLVVQKVKNNEMPPTILEADYKKLKITIN